MKLLISWLVLTFSITISDLISPVMPYHTAFGISLIAIGLGVILHELGHKFSAQSFGLDAEFNLFMYRLGGYNLPVGLIIMLVLGLITRGRFIFPIFGAVFIDPRRRRSELESYPRVKYKVFMEISYAGVLINIILAVIFGALFFAIPVTGIGSIFLARCFGINAGLAFFNLLPMPMTDGSQIFALNKKVWLAFFIVPLAMMVLLVAVTFM